MNRRIIRAAAASLAGFAFHASAAPNSAAVEFYNTQLDHYFVTADAAEALGIDAGAAGPGWQRTGRSFPVWTTKSAAPADAQPVCRFYSSAANSHFYTASASECAGLKALQANAHAAPGAFNGWGYEGTAFYVQVPNAAGTCAAGTTPLTRAYNDGFASGAGSNHRFVDDASLAQLMADQSWKVEGTAMCAQSKSAGGIAPLAQTSASFDALVGTWEGTAAFKLETGGQETRVLGAISLTIDDTGAITGTGAGCTFAGQLDTGDGFRAHFRGSITATGCTDASFDGTYDRVHFERLGAWGVNLHMKREDGGTEAMIFGLLDNDAATSPPTLSAIAGDWVGTVAWKAESGGDEENETKVNQDLALTIADTGDVTGTGFGCTITGTVAPKPALGRHGLATTMFLGDLTASGCTDAAFDGTFTRAQLRLDGGELSVRITREGTDGEVEIEGDLTPATP